MQRVQYSPHPDIVPYFQTVPFAYSLDGESGHVLTTMNRVRKYMSQAFGIVDASRRLIEAILSDIAGKVLGEAIDTDGNLSRICYFHTWAFRRRVEIALRTGEIKNNPHERVQIGYNQ